MVFDTEKLRANVHDVISRRATHHLHRNIADMENTEDGLSNVQRKVWLGLKEKKS